MRILVFNWQDLDNPLAGGAEVHFHQVFSRIASLGHEITLFCSGYPGARPDEVRDGIRIIRQGGRNLFNYQVPYAYRTRFRRMGFDLVVDEMNKIPFMTPLFVREPILGICHHLFGKSIFIEANPAIAAYVYGMEALALRVYRAAGTPFVLSSPSTYNDFSSRGFTAERISIVNLAVDHSTFRVTGVPKSATPLVGHFGRLKRYKSVDVLLRAMVLARQTIYDLRAVIVGDGDDRTRLESLAQELGLSDAVQFTGFVAAEEQVEWMQKVWVAVATSAKEGWGMTTTEANACGTPVVASDVPGLRDSVRDGTTGLLYPYGDHVALAERLVNVLQNPGLRDTLAHGSINYAAEFTWDAAAEKTLEQLERRVRSGQHG